MLDYIDLLLLLLLLLPLVLQQPVADSIRPKMAKYAFLALIRVDTFESACCCLNVRSWRCLFARVPFFCRAPRRLSRLFNLPCCSPEMIGQINTENLGYSGNRLQLKVFGLKKDLLILKTIGYSDNRLQ